MQHNNATQQCNTTMQHNNATQQCNTTMQHNNVIKKNNKTNDVDIIQLYKIGKFYNIYGDDAIILNYLFGYKILIDGKVGFPETALNKVINTLEDKKISYRIINKNESDIFKNYGNLNCYKKILKYSLEYKDIKTRVERIQELINNVSDITILEKIIGVIENELQ